MCDVFRVGWEINWLHNNSGCQREKGAVWTCVFHPCVGLSPVQRHKPPHTTPAQTEGISTKRAASKGRFARRRNTSTHIRRVVNWADRTWWDSRDQNHSSVYLISSKLTFWDDGKSSLEDENPRIAWDNMFIFHFLSKGNKHKGIHHNWDNKNRSINHVNFPLCTAPLFYCLRKWNRVVRLCWHPFQPLII